MAAPVLTNYHVDYTSTIPANAGDLVKLFVRRRNGTQSGDPSRPVLMLHGRSVPALAGFDLQYKKYSWAEELAKAKFDVFVMELQGSGLSTRPRMDDPKNVSPAPSQRKLLVPHPNASPYTGPVDYAAQLNNSRSDWGEVDRVVDFILDKTGASKVDLIGWSAASQVFGPYAIQHPGKVRSLFLLAPIFPPHGRASASGTDFDEPVPLPVSTPGSFDYPMTVATKAGVESAWQKDLKCPDQREPGMLDEVWKAIMATDAVGAGWGPEVGTASAPRAEGLSRIRNSYWWGWNSTTVPLHGVLGGTVPVCLVYGENDTIVNTDPNLGLLYFSVPELYAKIPGAKKLMLRIACAGHQAPWERVANDVHTMSEHWLRFGKVEGVTTGSYYRDSDGALTPME
ncbi:alpha/beta fold hydrolase [Streptomyces sp. NBC_00503]|uniref:alpha/beta fold hydrolase n=1 Tax=Streptomyces sp. NBC_00503 TaxID=2903659 RepID=UPI002E81EFE0|nr:alpha/beta fold hydrolase [Streptomyces sp. NBC_00503]WUD84214.1 alpha/beta hydrolase [Streptomyces sp. NBC_00503]